MPAYNAASPPAIGPGESVVVWSAETPTPGNGTTAASQQVRLSEGIRPGTPCSIDGRFSADPGAFEIDVQAASSDNDADYQTVVNGNLTTRDNTNFTFRFDGSTVVARYLRLLMRSRTNNVSVTARISR
jgi:hypothetical protein